MLNTNKIASYTALVLIFGLVSCAQHEDSPSNSFHATPPKILRDRSAQDFRAWDQSSEKRLDLRDLIDARESGAARLTVGSRCQNGGRELFHTSHHDPHKPVGIFQVLPIELLAVDMGRKPLSCAFELVLSNDKGSRHIFNMPTTEIQDAVQHSGALALDLDSSAVPAENRYWRISQLKNLKFRKRNLALSQEIAIVCEAGQTRPLKIESVMNVADFDFELVNPHPAYEANAFLLRPVQRCRGVIFANAVPQEMSVAFELHFPEAALQISTLHQPYREVQRRDDIFDQAIRGNPVTFGEYQVTNHGVHGRVLHISKSPRLIQIIAGTRNQYADAPRSATRDWLNISIHAGDGTTIVDGGGHWHVNMGAGGNFKIVATFQGRGIITCNDVGGFAFYFPQNLEMVELSETGRELDRKIVPLGPRALIASQTDIEALMAAPYAEGVICGW